MPPPNSGQGQPDNSMGYFWILLVIFGALIGIWYFFRAHVIWFIFKLKYYELLPLSFVSHKMDRFLYFLNHVDPAAVSFNQFIAVVSMAGRYYSIPAAVIFFIAAFVVYRGNPTRMYTSNYDMQRLAKEETINWPQIGPVTKMNLIKEDLDKGPWAMSLRPMDYAKKNQLLKEVVLPLEPGKLRREQKIGVEVDEGKTNKLFAAQLGRPFTKVQALPIYVKALFAIMSARANRDRESADKLLKQIAESSCKNGQLNFNGAEELCKKHQNSKLVRAVTDRHAYVLTMMASLLELARTDGVLASAEFLWLKPIDRKLWYVLNNVGRQTAFTEVAGTMAHWLAERELARKILTPMVNEATIAFVNAIKEIEYKRDEPPPEDHPDIEVED